MGFYSVCSSLSPSVNQLELVYTWWENSSSESEAFFPWLSERERELDDIGSASPLDPLDKQLSTIEVCSPPYAFILCCPLLWLS